MTVYRNDEEARELLLQNLEVENRELAAAHEKLHSENEKLRSENSRLKIIGRELIGATDKATSSTAHAHHVSKAEIDEMQRHVVESARAHVELMLEAKRVKTYAILGVAMIFLVPTIIRMLLGHPLL